MIEYYKYEDNKGYVYFIYKVVDNLVVSYYIGVWLLEEIPFTIREHLKTSQGPYKLTLISEEEVEITIMLMELAK
jgi:hypothetical protein